MKVVTLSACVIFRRKRSPEHLYIVLTNNNNVTIIIIQDGVINLKPLVNLTINKLGLLDGDNDAASEKADSPTNVLKSMFRIWNPEVGVESPGGGGGGYDHNSNF